ncbi:hypothetical protein BH11PSE11_BH11PSE11_00690 [soil metagenome]
MITNELLMQALETKLRLDSFRSGSHARRSDKIQFKIECHATDDAWLLTSADLVSSHACPASIAAAKPPQ